MHAPSSLPHAVTHCQHEISPSFGASMGAIFIYDLTHLQMQNGRRPISQGGRNERRRRAKRILRWMDMRIAFVTYEYPPFIIGGAGIYGRCITRELARRGHEVVAFCPGPELNGSNGNGAEPADPIEVVRVRAHKRSVLKSLEFTARLPKALRETDREEPFDVIHINGVTCLFWKRFLSRAPHVLTMHHGVKDAIRSNGLPFSVRLKDVATENNVFMPFVERHCVQMADTIIAVSHYTRNEMTRAYGLCPETIQTIHSGIDARNFTPPEGEVAALRETLGLNGSRVVLFVGRVNDPRKDLDFLLRAFARLPDATDARLVVVGNGTQDVARESAHHLGIEEKVIFTGLVPDATLGRYYALCDVYASPSRLEGFGLTVLEAMAAGKPVVATRVGSLPELVEHGEQGLLVTPSDEQGMADALSTYLGDPSLAEEVGKRNAAFVRKQFRWETTAVKTEDVYRRVVETGSKWRPP
jgi:glycosyltransferase involved in cell wall biosynthesis